VGAARRHHLHRTRYARKAVKAFLFNGAEKQFFAGKRPPENNSFSVLPYSLDSLSFL
jgi:hypothetical protein